MDEVGGIVAAWQHEMPELDVSALHVFSRVDRLGAELARLRGAILTRHDLARWEFDVLAALRRAGEPYQLSAGALSAGTHVTTGTMTTRLDRLVERRLVRRANSREDLRVTLVRLTPAGRRRVDGALATLVGRERALLTGMSRPAQRELAASLQQLLDAVAAAERAPET
jgi:DNA-binding MarR family transcriptional regulator